MECQCTAEYDIEINGKKVEAYCGMWDSKGPWCFVHGGMKGEKCPGAKKSEHGEFYYTKDAEVCRTTSWKPSK